MEFKKKADGQHPSGELPEDAFKEHLIIMGESATGFPWKTCENKAPKS